MRAGLTPALEERLRRTDATARPIVIAQTVEKNANGALRAHVRKTRADWGEADGAVAGPPPTLAGFSLLPEGDVRLADNIVTLISQPAHPNNLTDLNTTAPFDVVQVIWGGNDLAEFEIARVKLWLNPRTTAATREAVKWKCALVHLVATVSKQDPATGFTITALRLGALCQPIFVDIVTDAEGEVTFDFSALARRPQPKRWGAPVDLPSGGFNTAYANDPVTFIFVYALNKDGGAANNVAMGYDAGLPSSGAGNVVSGRHLVAALHEFLFGPEALRDGGSAGGTPYVKIETGTYATATITFTANPFNLGGAPTRDVQLRLKGAVPTGCALNGEIRNDADSGYVPFTDGQWMIADLGLVPSTTRKLRASLVTNVATGSSLTPTLTELGLQAIAETNLDKLCTVSGGNWAIDPVSLAGEIPELTITAIRDGITDYRSAIEDLLANNHIGDIRLALYWGDDVLGRKDWLHVDDFLIDGSHPRAPDITLKCLSPLCLLRDFVPRYEPGEVVAPDGDQTIGAWTTDAGGAANLWQRLDEANFDDTDFIRSELTPANSSYELTLATPVDPIGRRHLVDYRFRKDAAGGEQIDLTVTLLQGGTIIAVAPVHVNIATDAALTTTAGSFSLTDEQVKLISDYTNLRVRFTANKNGGAGARRAVVSWCRFRTGGKRDQVAYPNAGVPTPTLKAVYEDLLTNALAIDARYRGPGVEDAVNLVAKVIFESDVVGKPTGKAEIDAIAYIAGGGIISSQGRITFREMYGNRAIRAVFPSDEIRMEAAGPGYEERVPEFFVKSTWNAAKGDFDDEVRAFSSGALLNLGPARLGPPRVVDDGVSKWLSNPNLDAQGLTLADRIATRQTIAIGTGLLEWRFTSNYAYPELEPGDLIRVETDQFVARDPVVARALRGAVWATGVINRCDVTGRHFSVWILGYADIVPVLEPAARLGLGPATPHILGVKAYGADNGDIRAIISVNAGLAVRVAASTVGMPTDATVRAAALQTLDAMGQLTSGVLATIAPGGIAYVKAFAYERIDGSGLESPAGTSTINLGIRPRNFILGDGLYPLAAQSDDGMFTADAVRFDPGNGVYEGGAVFKIYRHREEITINGADADGDVPVTFAQVYQSVPMIVLKGGQYVSFSQTLGTGAGAKHRLRLQSVDATISGFTSRAQIASLGVTTAQTDDFASGNGITTVGGTADVDLQPGGANDDKYTVNYRVSVTVDLNPTLLSTATLVVAIDTNDGVGGWIERATYSYATSDLSGPPPFEANTATWDTEAKQITVTGLGTGDDIRIRAKSFSVNNGGTGSFVVRGADAGGANPDTRNGVLYTTAADTIESAIPAGGDSVVWSAQEVI